MKKSSQHHRRRRSPAVEGEETVQAEGMRPPTDDGVPMESGDAGIDNDLLTDSAVQFIERVRPHLGKIVAVAVAGLVALGAFVVVSSQAETRRAQSWESCMAALSTGDLAAFNEVVRRYPGTEAARWAELLVADAAAAEGADLLFIDRQRAENRLRAAVEMYSSLMTTRPQGLLAERTVFGLAKARECLGQLDEARRGYEAIAAEFPGDPIASIAAGRAAELGRDATRQWYDWFGAQQISPAGSPSANVAPDAPANAESQPPAAGQP